MHMPLPTQKKADFLAIDNYNPPNNFFGLSMGKTDHVKQNRTISAVGFHILRLILFRRNKGQETSKRSR